MALRFEELKVLRAAEAVADGIWRSIVQWDAFSREVVGGQMAKAGDSIGANIAEAYGRFHYGEKLQFLYYARGSLFETKYWLNRAQERGLMSPDQVQRYASQLSDLARQLNAFATSLKTQRRGKPKTEAVSESITEYVTASRDETPTPVFTENELAWLQTAPNP